LRVLLAKAPVLVDARGTLKETPTPRQIEDGEKIAWHTTARLDVTAIRVRHSDWTAAVGSIVISTPAQLTNLFAGQLVEISGVAATPRPASAPGLFDYRNYLRRIGIYYQLTAQSPQDWKILSNSAPPLADRFR